MCRFRILTVLVTFWRCVITQGPEFSYGCAEGSCYPATGDLLIGRADRLSATSTCGKYKPEPFCIVSHLQEEKKCFSCDSRTLFAENPNSHRIENVVTTFAHNRLNTWWQSENGVENVSLQLNLEAEFHFTHLIMTFKTFRPAAMMIERSSDFGESWQVYRYYAYDCESSFPGIPTGSLKKVDDIICDSRYSDIEPSTEGEVIYRVLDPAFKIEDPYSRRIQNMLKITNLRIKFTKLHTLGDNLLDSRMEIKEKYYYAIYDMVVRGNCFCYGHASECAPVHDSDDQDVDGKVHGRCVCRHNTKGLNCELCQDFHHNAPWKPAEGRNSNACQRCSCNGHADKCHFDMAVYKASGNVSGGVCDGCRNNTMGQHCEQCKPFYYQHPERSIRASDICEPCNCDPAGSLNGGICDSHTDLTANLIAGQCRCKLNIEGERCDLCKEGFFGLSADDPLGCQPCICNHLGTHPGGTPCNDVTGNCFCKRLVMGKNCDQCLPQHWGLSNDLDGCRPCDCDLGGSYNNDCSAETGQCPCKEHMVGRRCNEVESGFYFIALDHYTYEAEEADLGPEVKIVQRQHPQDRSPTWTGTGFVRIPEGAYLEFHIHDIPHSMEYDILIRYEPQLPKNWEEAKITVYRPGKIHTNGRCGNTTPGDDNQVFSLPSGSRYVVLPQPVCFEKGLNYTIGLELTKYSSDDEMETPYTLIDSLVLMPHCRSLDIFSVGESSEIVTNRAWETFQRYRCLENSQSVTKTPMTEVCRGIVSSISSIIHEGALPCRCDPQGSLSSVCNPSGGQCQCRSSVVGRNCDRCAPATYGFGPSGCRPCDCHKEGSVSEFCHHVTGQCRCNEGVFSRQCDQCQPGYWGFPNCRPCQCNGHADHCDLESGECLGCRDHTGGHNCNSCLSGYYGDPVLGSGDHCRSCPCPDGPHSGRQFSTGCYQDRSSRNIICHCQHGYTGARCDECASGFYGNPNETRGRCQECQCSNNIDMTDAESCDKQTGECLKCLYHTEGESCNHCKLGYYGNALQQNCKKCVCNYLGTLQAQCTSADECYCNQTTGQCPCLPNVIGLMCDHCAPNTWKLASGTGCELCSCNEVHSRIASCNEFTGQCQCMAGFGGRTCSDCQEFFWGDPDVECMKCDCNEFGIETQQCNQTNGHCICREGIAGERCDKCARGYSGTFPHCEPCHACFRLWDKEIEELTTRSKQLLAQADSVKASGIVGPYQETVNAVQEKINDIRTLLAENPATEPLDSIGSLLEEAKKKVIDLSEKVNVIESDLGTTADRNNVAETELNVLQSDAEHLKAVVNELAKQLEYIKNSDVHGALDSVQKYFNQSLEAEVKVNVSTIDPDNTLLESLSIREKVDDMISESQDHFEQQQKEHSQSLEELADKLQNLDLSPLSEKICGSPAGIPCAEAQCGGPNCRADDGTRKCGGIGCDGLVTLAHKAWQDSVDFDTVILNALAEVDQLSKMVADAKIKADEAKLNAQKVLLKTNTTKEKVDKSNEDLRNLIKQIREFLTQDGADLESIEAVANEVLKLEMPTTPQQLQDLTNDIRTRVESLSDVEIILNQSAADIERAEALLDEARKSRILATEVKDAADRVKEALDEAEKAQNAAAKAIKQANEDIEGTQDLLTSIESETVASEQSLNNATERLAQIEKDIDELKQKTAGNTITAENIGDTADKIKQAADEAKQVLDTVLKEKYTIVEDAIVKKSDAASDARKKAKLLQIEAESLLSDASRKLELLKKLERNYDDNQKALEEKAQKLIKLEEDVRSLLQTISQKVAIYSTCL
ncbi:laminin subunit beta-1a isoform X1 [Carcharodon carcharias]|uniref:laminin subunit beta-1a isoform X1 n=2 Tax=Carcharodon carcharias TaxID=13397 RepID=UPI001B7F6890|nr:laminin subunit beta-1a isoform X1 [Carcharodon carcharias]